MNPLLEASYPVHKNSKVVALNAFVPRGARGTEEDFGREIDMGNGWEVGWWAEALGCVRQRLCGLGPGRRNRCCPGRPPPARNRHLRLRSTGFGWHGYRGGRTGTRTSRARSRRTTTDSRFGGRPTARAQRPADNAASFILPAWQMALTLGRTGAPR